MYENIFRHILFPLQDKVLHGRDTLKLLSEYEKQQWLSYEEIKKIQFNKLKKLVDYAYLNVEYYKNTWDECKFHPNDLTSLDVFEQLPFLNKELIRNNYNSLIANPLRDTNLKKATGGSTGVPLQFEYTEESYVRRNAVMWRGYSWAHLNLGVKSTYLWGTSIGDLSKWSAIKDNLYNKFYGREMLSCFEMDEEKYVEYVKKINQRKPKVIVSYVNPIYMLAKWISDNGINVYSPSSIITGAEPLHDYQRELIESVFKTKTFNTYGSREFMLMASECDQFKGLHMNIDHLVIETVNKDGKTVCGNVGEVAVTDLHNFGMPFIRYKNEDLGVISNSLCECGRGLPLMEKVVGRTLDCIQTLDGKVLPGEFFPHMLKDYSGLVKFQVIQDTLSTLDIKLVTDGNFKNDSINEIKQITQNILGNSINVDISIVDDIPLTKSGKHRVTISNIELH